MLRIFLLFCLIASSFANSAAPEAVIRYNVLQRDEVAERVFVADPSQSDGSGFQMTLAASTLLRSQYPSFQALDTGCEVLAQAMAKMVHPIVRNADASLPSEEGGFYKIQLHNGGAGEAFMVVSWKRYFSELEPLFRTLKITSQQVDLQGPLEYKQTATVAFTEGDWASFMRGERVEFEVAGDDPIHLLERSIPAFEALFDLYFKASTQEMRSSGLIQQTVSEVSSRTTFKAYFQGTRERLVSFGPTFERSVSGNLTVGLPDLQIEAAPPAAPGFELLVDMLLAGESLLQKKLNEPALTALRQENFDSAIGAIAREIEIARARPLGIASEERAAKLKMLHRAHEKLGQAHSLASQFIGPSPNREQRKALEQYLSLQSYAQQAISLWGDL